MEKCITGTGTKRKGSTPPTRTPSASDSKSERKLWAAPTIRSARVKGAHRTDGRGWRDKTCRHCASRLRRREARRAPTATEYCCPTRMNRRRRHNAISLPLPTPKLVYPLHYSPAISTLRTGSTRKPPRGNMMYGSLTWRKSTGCVCGEGGGGDKRGGGGGCVREGDRAERPAIGNGVGGATREKKNDETR